MAIDLAQILLAMLERRASDLHLTAGAPPMLRVRGRLQGLEGHPPLTPQDTREAIYSILGEEQRKRLENDLQLDFAELPGLTKLTIALSDAVRGYPWAIFGALALAVVGFRRWKRTPAGRAQWDRLRLRIPLRIGEIQRKIALARWSRTLASLVSAGVPMLEAIEVTGRTAGNSVVERAMESVLATVRSGGTIASALREEPVFPAMVAHMVAVGEETGSLDGTLSKVADFYEDEVDAGVKALTSILEPAMIVLVGAIVGVIVLSMYLPMFQVYDEIE